MRGGRFAFVACADLNEDINSDEYHPKSELSDRRSCNEMGQLSMVIIEGKVTPSLLRVSPQSDTVEHRGRTSARNQCVPSRR